MSGMDPPAPTPPGGQQPSPPRTGTRPAWAPARDWLRANSFTPTWLPPRWSHPAAGYLLVVPVQVAVAFLTRVLLQAFPTYAFLGVIEILTVTVIALTCGAGPGIFAALVGLVLEEALVLPIQGGGGRFTPDEMVQGITFLAVGIAISLVASATERARRRATQERAEAKVRELALIQTQARVDEFLAIASHDLRSPLTVATGYIDLAARKCERLVAGGTDGQRDLAGQVAAVHGSVREASHACARLARFVDLLFDTTRARAGTLELRRVPCDLAAVVQGQMAALQMANPGRALRLEATTGGLLPVVADAERVGQVVTNFVTNALKYSPTERPVTVRVAVEGAWARVAVEDRGPGLPEGERERVWGRFYRAEGARAQGGAAGGLGMGLYICKTIVEGHEGQVGVESTPGQGSIFWFTLPLAALPIPVV